MATKITDQFYEIAPSEGLTFTITGPDDPRVFLDNPGNQTLQVTSGASFRVGPELLSGMGSTHTMNCILLFPAGRDTYAFVVDSDSGANLASFPVPGPNQGTFTKFQISIQVG